ncbi:unnamed protein product [Heterosigma akashiwo]
MLKQKMVEKSRSGWNFPVFCVGKKDTTEKRVVYDMRRLNEATLPVDFPIPTIQSLLDHLSGASIFSTIDLKSGFYQVEIEEGSRDYFSFSTRKGKFRMTRLPMGWKNSSYLFQERLLEVFGDLIYKGVLIYIDDIIIYSSDINEHMDLLLMVLDRFLDRNLIINLEKSHFLLEQIKYLGHVVDADGIRPDTSKIQIIHNTRPPENISELKTFLGLVGFYRDYLPRLSEFAAPLWELDKKDVVWDWSPRHQKAFEDIKSLIGEHTMMTHFDSDLDVEVYSDASDVAICFIISPKRTDGHVVSSKID